MRRHAGTGLIAVMIAAIFFVPAGGNRGRVKAQGQAPTLRSLPTSTYTTHPARYTDTPKPPPPRPPTNTPTFPPPTWTYTPTTTSTPTMTETSTPTSSPTATSTATPALVNPVGIPGSGGGEAAAGDGGDGSSTNPPPPWLLPGFGLFGLGGLAALIIGLRRALGGSPAPARKKPGRLKWGDITLKRGLNPEPGTPAPDAGNQSFFDVFPETGEGPGPGPLPFEKLGEGGGKNPGKGSPGVLKGGDEPPLKGGGSASTELPAVQSPPPDDDMPGVGDAAQKIHPPEPGKYKPPPDDGMPGVGDAAQKIHPPDPGKYKPPPDDQMPSGGA